MASHALHALPPGADFPAELVAGLLARHGHAEPEALARLTLILNTQRMQRRVADCLVQAGVRLLPRLVLVADVAKALSPRPLPPRVSPLRRQLHLAQLIDRLIATGSTALPRTALYPLAESLARLMDEMQGEGVPPDRIAALDVGDHSAHWARMQTFLGIVTEALGLAGMDGEARTRAAVLALAELWQHQPPADPVIVAGSTGSRGTTALLIQAVAHLPNGAVVLPGFDFDQPPEVWDGMEDALTAEDHPQYRFRRLLDALSLQPADVQRWTAAPAPDPARNRVISLSLRPAPVTDRWLAEGAALPDLVQATQGLTLIEAPDDRTEGLAIALALREAAETGVTAALVTPDRTLARRVTAALDRWGIRPDDSAGRPLALSAPGRLLGQVASLIGQRLTIDMLLALVKHPLAFSGEGGAFGRGAHLLLTRAFELSARRHGPAFPTPDSLAAWAATVALPGAADWAAILGAILRGLDQPGPAPLPDLVARHLSLTERLAQGFAPQGSGGLWQREAGAEAAAAMADLRAEADVGGRMTPGDYAGLLRTVLAGREVRETQSVHPGILIRGTLEARVQGAHLVILGGLNEGTWPAPSPPDPWLNRAMRRDAGLLLPERQIGLSAHDYQQAVAAPRAILSRSRRGAEAETVPSRWLNRLLNLLRGLPDRRGPEAVAAMQARGDRWLALARVFDTPPGLAVPAPRPSPRPPVAARPRQLSVTEIKTLIRDPYAIYARHVLGLRPLDPLRPEADPRLRGVVLHEILESFVRAGGQGVDELLAIADRVLAARVAWPLARAVWRARIAKAAQAFLDFSAGTGGTPVLLEQTGRAPLPGQDFLLTGKPDRIDRLADGRLLLIDYKTGDPPSPREQAHFDKQLWLLAAMAETGAFAELGPQEVARIVFVGLKAELKLAEPRVNPGDVTQVWSEFGQLIASYARPTQGYTARRAMQTDRTPSDYDHLSRLGEWDVTSGGAGR
jgi:double-strand break repair protein AddB